MLSNLSEHSKHIYKLRAGYEQKKDIIKSRLDEFKEVFEKGDDRRIFEELTFCILTSAAGPRTGFKALNAIKDSLIHGGGEELYMRLKNEHKYPERAVYIVHTREYLKSEYNFELKRLILSFESPIDRRDFFASNRDIKGIGFLQASHFLRNVGFFGYALLDKNVLRSLYELGVIENKKPPTTRSKYIDIENRMKQFADTIEISIDELDLLLWSGRTGHIPK
jgi:N-glycosylase/DNA lyase